MELLEIPTRYLDDAVVQAGLKARAGDLGHRVLNLIQRDAETKLGSNKSQGISGSFRSKCGRTGETSVDLNEVRG